MPSGYFVTSPSALNEMVVVTDIGTPLIFSVKISALVTEARARLARLAVSSNCIHRPALIPNRGMYLYWDQGGR